MENVVAYIHPVAAYETHANAALLLEAIPS